MTIADGALVAVAQRESVHPVAREDPQVDIRTQHHRRMRPGVIVQIGAVLLVHAMLVAGQRHDRAQIPQRREQPVDVTGQAHHTLAVDARGHQMRLAHAQLLGQIADAAFRIPGAGIAQALRRAVERGHLGGEVGGGKAGHGNPFHDQGSGGRRVWRKAGLRGRAEEGAVT